MKVSAYGDRAVLIDTEQPLALRDAVISRADPRISEVTSAARTVLIEFTEPVRDVAGLLTGLELSQPAARSQTVLELPVCSDGADLAEVADTVGVGVAELIRWHADAEYTVSFCGFAPGFAYLTGLDERLRLPRLTTPRVTVPAGSVAIADEFTGVYPRSSPGGWRLLGRTEVVLFELDREPPALLTPGRRVRFIPEPTPR